MKKRDYRTPRLTEYGSVAKLTRTTFEQVSETKDCVSGEGPPGQCKK